MQKEEYLIKNACCSPAKYYLCKQNNKRSLLGRKQRNQVVRSFPNRYQYSYTKKVTSLFSIRYILIIILPRKGYDRTQKNRVSVVTETRLIYFSRKILMRFRVLLYRFSTIFIHQNSELFCQKVKACTSETAHLQGIKVDNRRRNGEQTGVETVEHSTVSGKDISAVLDA